MHITDAYFAPSTILFPYELKKIFDRILHEVQYLDRDHSHHFTLDLGQLNMIFEYRFIQSSSYSLSVTDVCDGILKSKNITAHGNATIIEQKGTKLVYSVEQLKSLELMTIVGEKCLTTGWTGYRKVIGYKSLKSEKASHFSLNYQARRFN